MKINKSAHLFPLLILFVFVLKINAQEKDSVKNYWLNQIEIKSSRMNLGDTEMPVEKENLSSILNKSGFSLIRKGVFFAQDIYSDGFKKSDISVVIDGERYHSACPNRMDSPISRVNPIELSTVDLIKTSGLLQSGLGGLVEFHRSEPGENLKIKVGLSGTGESSQSIDGAVLFEGYKNRLTFRYASGKPYEDAEGRNFKDNYGYKENFNYMLNEVSFHGKSGNIKYSAAFTYSDDISFPYLKMDERINRIFNSSLSYKENKIYFNYTRHIMNNSLRVSPMFMETDAENLTIGAVGNFYEVVYRNWNADNQIIMPMAKVENKLIPNLSLFSAVVNKKWAISSFLIFGKVGIVSHSLGEENQLTFYQTLYPGAKENRLFPTFGISVNYSTAFYKNLGAGLLIEAASEAPEIETLYIAVTRPMNNPNWVGNPELNQSFKTTIRGSINYDRIRVEFFGTNVWNYVNQTQITVNGKPNVTYKNVDAYMLGINLDAEWKYLNINANYTYAQNQTNDSPLAEIPPLKITTTLLSPEYSGFIGFIKHTYNDAQTRVDFSLSENSTVAWNKFDIGISYLYKNLYLTLEIENITNQLYYQHLSYLRDPFASGANVFEPGRTLRLNIKYDNIF